MIIPMAFLAHKAYVESHSLLNCIKAAMEQVYSSYFGLLIKNITNEKCNKLVMMFSLVVGYILGGGNYTTALLTLELSVLLFLICYKYKRNKIIRVIVPIIINGIGFLISVIAPENQVRWQYFLYVKLDAIRSILYSFRYGIKYINNWMNIWLILGLLLLAPFIWKAVIKMSYEWKYPGLVIYSSATM